MPWSCAAGHEMGADQPVGGRPADREADRQRPERPRPGRVAQGPEGPPDGADLDHRQLTVVTAGEVPGGAVGRVRVAPVHSSGRRAVSSAQLRGASAHRRAGPRDRTGSSGRTAAPAAPRPARATETSSDADRQPYCSASQAINGRKTSWPVALAGGEHAHHQPAAADEPAVGDRRGEDQRHRTGAEPDQHAPGQHQLPAGW